LDVASVSSSPTQLYKVLDKLYQTEYKVDDRLVFYSSFDILYEKYVLQKSKFTLREIGIILASNRTYLKKYNGQYTEIYLNMFIIKANINMITKRTFDK
jgi:hypothetical protein